MVTYFRESEAGEGAREEDVRLKDEEKEGVGEGGGERWREEEEWEEEEGGGERGGDGERETEEDQRDYAVVDLYRGWHNNWHQ